MAKIVNLSSRQIEEVEDSEVNSLISNGSYGFMANEEISVVEGSTGQVGTLPANEAINEITSGGYSYIGQEEITKRNLVEKFGSTGQQAIGLAEQAASGLTLGLSEVVEVALGVPAEDIQGRNIVTGATGDIANFAGTMLPLTKLGQGIKAISLLGSPVRALDKLGMGAEASAKIMLNKSLKNKVLKRSLELGTRGAVEGALFNSSNYLKEVTLGNVEFNSEAFLSSGVQGGKFGSVAGGVLGGGAAIAQKAARKSKLNIEKSIKKFAGENGEGGGLRLKTKGKDLKQKDLTSDVSGKGSEFYLDANNGLYKYTDNIREVYIDPLKINGKVLDLSDSKELNRIGAQLEVPSLADKVADWDQSKTGFSEFLENQRFESLNNASSEIVEGSISRISKNREINKKLDQLRKGWNRHRAVISKLQSSRQTPKTVSDIKKSRTKVSQLQAKYKKLRSSLVGFDDKSYARNGKVGTFNAATIDKEVSNILKNYSAIKIGNRIVVKRLDSLDDAIESAVTIIKTKKKKDQPSFGDIKTLNLSGADKAYFKRKPIAHQKELAKFMRDNFRSDANERLISHPLLTDLDDLMVNVERKRVSAIEKMDSSINHMENILEEGGLSSNITGSQIADSIIKKMHPQFFDSVRGKTLPNLQSSADAVIDFAESFRDFGKSKATGTDIPFSPSELRKLRINMDKFPGLDFDKTQALSRELIKTARQEMEDALVKSMAKFDDAGGFLKQYKDAKKEYGLAMDANKILENRFSKESGNNAISLTGYLAAGAGAGFGGLPGAVAAMGLRELGRSYGNNLLALYADRVLKSQTVLSNKITKSVKGFLESSSSVKFTPVIGLVSKRDIVKEYEESIKEIDSGEYDFEAFSEDFIESNQGLMETFPETSNVIQEKIGASYAMIMEKLPTDPYQNSFIKKYRPSDSELRRFQRYKTAILDPSSILAQISNGIVSNEAIEVLERIYPATYKVMQFEMMEALSSGGEIGYKKRNHINKLFKIETDSYQRIDNVILLQEMIKSQRVEEEQGVKIKGDKKNTRAKSRQTSGQRMMEK